MSLLIIAHDIETTGLDPIDHRIVEFYGACWRWNGSGEPEKIDELFLRINPERNIPVETTRIHGISASDVAGCKTWSEVASSVYRFLASGDVLLGHNAKGFDVPFINSELRRVGLAQVNLPVIDTMLEGRWATPNGKVPNLGELCFACGVDYDASKAHAADYDVDVMMRSFVNAVRWGWLALPFTLPVSA